MKNYMFLSKFQFKNGLELKNKVVMAPMTTMSSFHNGMITKEEIEYYAARSEGLGMIISAVAYVSETGKGFEGQLSVASNSMITGLQKIAHVIKQNEAKAILQIFHVGRKGNSQILRGVQTVSASAIAATYPEDSEQPRALTNDEIETIIAEFGEATRRAIQAGFDGIELHGANTYLLQQFYSENSNQRTDQWGGSRDSRLKFPLAVIASATNAIKKYADRPFLLGYRISPEEVETPGISLEDSLYFVDQIKEQVDYIHLSMGSYQRTSLNDKENKKTILSQFTSITKGVVPLIGVGSVETPDQAEAVLNDGADLVALGRELLREPKWVQKVMNADEESIRTRLSPDDMDELMIPAAMQHYLKESFESVMHFTTADKTQFDSYEDHLAPMEGYEKKL